MANQHHLIEVGRIESSPVEGAIQLRANDGRRIITTFVESDPIFHFYLKNFPTGTEIVIEAYPRDQVCGHGLKTLTTKPMTVGAAWKAVRELPYQERWIETKHPVTALHCYAKAHSDRIGKVFRLWRETSHVETANALRGVLDLMFRDFLDELLEDQKGTEK